MPPKLDEYMPWVAIYHGGCYAVVRDSFGPPFGPRLWAERNGKIITWHHLQDAWADAHKRNQELYLVETPRRDRENHPDDWILTYTGRKFWPFDPRPEEIHVEDIAHALSCTGRWGGHTREFFSVAQHSYYVSHRCEDPLWGLLHDAAEAYLVDLPRPIKQALRMFGQLEDRILECVAERFDLPWPLPECVHTADNALLQAEAAALMPQCSDWELIQDQSLIQIRPWAPIFAEDQFLRRFRHLTGDIGCQQ